MKPLRIRTKWWLTLLLFMFISSVVVAQGVDTTLVMAVGDSFVAGFQNGGLSIDGQRNSFPAVVARQMGAFLPLPTITAPGIPPVLKIVPPNLTPVPSSNKPGSLILPPLGNSFHFNLGVPGFKVRDVLTQRPQLPDPVNRPFDILRDLILGIPSLAIPGSVNTGSQIEQIEVMHPTFVIAWFGGNDVLGALTSNNASLVTPFDQFSADYISAMKRIQASGAKVVTANIPDITISPLLVPAPAIAIAAGVPFSVVGPALGLTSGDFVYLIDPVKRTSTINLILAILTGQASGPLPRSTVLTASDAATIRTALLKQNDFIKSTAASMGIPMADFFTALNNIRANGIQVGGRKLTTAFLGGIVSLDFIHPTNTGYAVLANEMIKAVNSGYGTNFALADLNAVFASDPLGGFVTKRDSEDDSISIFDLNVDPDWFAQFQQIMNGSGGDNKLPPSSDTGGVDPGNDPR